MSLFAALRAIRSGANQLRAGFAAFRLLLDKEMEMTTTACDRSASILLASRKAGKACPERSEGMPALQLLYFQYEFCLDIRTHREKRTKPAKNAGASERPQKKEIPFCLWKSLQAIDKKQSLKRTKPFEPTLRTHVFDVTH